MAFSPAALPVSASLPSSVSCPRSYDACPRPALSLRCLRARLPGTRHRAHALSCGAQTLRTMPKATSARSPLR
eukprot:1787823-Rhodomonas_salina.1